MVIGRLAVSRMEHAIGSHSQVVTSNSPITGSPKTGFTHTGTPNRDRSITRNSQEWIEVRTAKKRSTSHGRKGRKNLGLGKNVSQDLVEPSRMKTRNPKVRPKRAIVGPSRYTTRERKVRLT